MAETWPRERGRTMLAVALALSAVISSPAGAKTKRDGVVVQPELRILGVEASPQPYRPESGELEFKIQVQLPATADEATVLEVSSLITSPSKRSMRFLTSRQPVMIDASSPGEAPASVADKRPKVVLTLVWDGIDQARQVVESGRYQYEIRARLLSQDERGMRTQMVSWPKRGTVVVAGKAKKE